MATEELDVAIVGAGVSGVWCGWRLTGGGANKEARKGVAVFELSDRVGGRLLSVRLPGLPNVACELGGMRYMSSQPLVKWLVEDELDLPRIPAPVERPENIAYLRGELLRMSELADAANLPYNLSARERLDPMNLLADAIDCMAPGATGTFGDALRLAVQTERFDGKLLADQGFWNILMRVMSSEGYSFAQAVGGYDTTQLNWNAADMVVLNSDFSPTVRFSRLCGGYEEVPRKLAEAFEDQGGAVHLRQRVVSVDAATLSDESDGLAIAVEDVETGSVRTVHARAVILALPRRSLEMLSATGPLLGDDGFRGLMTKVTPIPLFKAFVAYHTPWWEQLGIDQGRSVTDLPLRQVYYWSSTTKHNSVLLATYDDTDNVSFWRGLAGDPESYGLRLEHLPDYARTRIEAATAAGGSRRDAPAALIDEIHRQLTEMHGLLYAPPPYAAVYHDWSGDPYGGGVNFWNVGVKSWEVIPQMIHPVESVPAYVCGEAYSDAQGWVEGALRTSERLLTTHLGLDPLDIPAGP